MSFYALASVPLIKRLTTSVGQAWYDDDAAVTGNIMNLRKRWDDISNRGKPLNTMLMPPNPGWLSSQSS